ncbi:MAG TPA: hypothetical protein DD624_01500 [Alphaproteobacteria bacterium]|nr:hypothetical protein [Alphaproteobacteria bacterium]
MPTPVATIANLTATGDVILGPGGITTMVKGLPVACVGDAVAGPMCVGAVTMTTAVNKLAKGRPIANMGAVVSGSCPAAMGAPIATPVMVCPNLNEIV